MDAAQLIKQLELERHPFEGGYFRRTYCSPHLIEAFGHPTKNRASLSAIYYLLTAEEPLSYLHWNRADILHFHHFGSAVRYWVVDLDGRLRQELLGPDLVAGQKPQLCVPGGSWKASRLESGPYALISEAVTPEFDYAEHRLATRSEFEKDHSQLMAQLECLIKPDSFRPVNGIA